MARLYLIYPLRSLAQSLRLSSLQRNHRNRCCTVVCNPERGGAGRGGDERSGGDRRGGAEEIGGETRERGGAGRRGKKRGGEERKETGRGGEERNRPGGRRISRAERN